MTTDYPRPIRLVALIDFLRDRRGRTLYDLQREFGVSERTAYRDLCGIERWYPLERKHGRYRIPRRVFFPGGRCRACGEPMRRERSRHADTALP